MSYPPYMNSTGLISKIFVRISEAQKRAPILVFSSTPPDAFKALKEHLLGR